ncbi:MULTISPECIES: Wzy polymerase domain-containing protein [unclassified Acinetobacter]|uniref:PglL family O-oligosaccharyltransferase n=1 Tax=unclassified Acinetobacter TaxID=196816 RepID=UPI002881387D|nr:MULTISPECIES: Wzy polymerase domain-containing protein [unclassified Acinetobacter]MDT0198377.1 Wzy polymerase domain-containing protein [Acinetobacter sp. RG5]MDT0229829.1 Wzy polymerase domain-containing protein [Acinetobacter sp. RRD8]
MKFTLALIAAILISLAWLMPVHYRPWVTYTGELYAFFALFAIAAVCIREKLTLPAIGLPLLLLACVPFIHFLAGQVFFFSTAMMGFIFVFSFWFVSALGYHLSTGNYNREETFTNLSYVFLASGTATGIIAICQWTNLDSVLPGMVNISGTQRPYANFAQPNNMATFLVMALMSCLYLYEKKKIQTKWLFACAALIVMGVALSQSRTAWVAAIAIILYLGFYQYKSVIRLKWYYSIAWFIFFIFCIVAFPLLSQLAAQAMNTDVVQSRDVVSRATGDMSRIAIWQQMIAAIQAQPWSGYGWYQTSAAFVSISDTVQGPVWVRSAHNFIIDFLLWNGLIIGLPFLAYFGYLGYQLQRWVNTPESVIGILMIGAFVTHAMFEFPQHYAYFLLPVGFILGTVLAQNLKIKTVVMPLIGMKFIFAVGLLLLIVIYRDYDVAVPKLGQSIRYEKQPEKITNEKPIYLLTEFNHRIAWIRLNPYSKASADQILEGEQMVLSYPTKYNLIKYAKLLAFNGYEAEAKHQLQRLKTIQKTEMSYEELTQDVPR